jgi:pyruvate-ferredoxin/flavodoxin oxidoreductase
MSGQNGHVAKSDGHGPASDGHGPASDGGDPNSDGSAPNSDGGAPSSDGGAPTPEVDLSNGPLKAMDGCEAVADVAYRLNEVCAIFPITPSSPMAEFADQWSVAGRPNLWGTVPAVAQMQSEGGAAGTVHGALQTGALTTTFTASQGLLLMIPNMYKIAGELTSAVFHVASRSVASQALSIFGDQSDVMAARMTGFGMLCAASVQEAHDMAVISQAATLRSRIPFMHFFDGFRTSHEINKIATLTDEQLHAMIDDDLIFAHRSRGLDPEHPVVRGTAQNPDIFFQAREGVNRFYEATPNIMAETMDRFAAITGRQYRLFDYHGSPDASRVIVLMGSGTEAVRETVDYLHAQGEDVGVVQVHLYRPFSWQHLVEALPGSTRSIAVLDRTKEPGAMGEPLYLDVIAGLAEARTAGALPTAEALTADAPTVIGGRYGLSSKEFTPAMIRGIYEELGRERPKNHFTIGIRDDVTGTSLEYDADFDLEPDEVYRAVFHGLGSDGTVGANKNSIKIISEDPDSWVQGYFVYDSRKAGSRTVSHLRFGPRQIRSTYLIGSADFVACHQPQFLEQIDMLSVSKPGSVFLLNSPHTPDEVWDSLPREIQQQIREKRLEFYAIDAYDVATEAGMGSRINTIMQTCFFEIAGVIPSDVAIGKIKKAIEKTYAKKGAKVVESNFAAVDQALANLHRIEVPKGRATGVPLPVLIPDHAPDFVRNVTAMMLAGRGDALPVSALPVDGTYPMGTTAWEKRNLSPEVPIWEQELCIQCGNCAFVCPHAVIQAKFYDESELDGAPADFKSAPLSGRGFPEMRYTLHISVEDCTGCLLCIEACPAESPDVEGFKAINMGDKEPILEQERQNLVFFEGLPEHEVHRIDTTHIRGVQYLRPLFEYSGACAGCGETPYLKLMTQLYGDRLLIANATGCSSIFGGNLPTHPWTVNADGRGPAWSNSLFEDNAEFGFGFRLAVDKHREQAQELLRALAADLGETPIEEMLNASQRTAPEIQAQRERVETLKRRLQEVEDPRASHLLSVADRLVRRSIWIVGGDGWAYDIGYGGLDHVLASGRDVNVLVLDTEVYSNTGGQASKATPKAAVAKFAAGGKRANKKDLGLMATAYGSVYVAQIAMGARDEQTLRAFREAEEYEGTSLIIAYSHCIAHGIDIHDGLLHQQLAVRSGYWPLYRYHPTGASHGGAQLQLDCLEPSIPFKDYALKEGRYRLLSRADPKDADRLLEEAQEEVDRKWQVYKNMAAHGVEVVESDLAGEADDGAPIAAGSAH